jgi:tetratricopeptide (TPR) repeat protein
MRVFHKGTALLVLASMASLCESSVVAATAIDVRSAVYPRKGVFFPPGTYVSDKKGGRFFWVAEQWIDGRNLMVRDVALVEYTEQLRRNPDDAFAYYCRAMARLRDPRNGAAYEKSLNCALADLTDAVRLVLPSVAVHSALGEVYSAKHDHENAIRHFSAALRLDPKDSLSYSNRGEEYWVNGQFAKADDDFNDAFTRNRNSPYANYNLAVSLRRSNDPGQSSYSPANDEQAITYLETAYRNAAGCPYSSFFGPRQIRGDLTFDPSQKLRVEELRLLVADALAWILATRQNHQPDDGVRAIRYARTAEWLTKVDEYRNQYRDTLAQAYATHALLSPGHGSGGRPRALRQIDSPWYWYIH